MVRGRLDIGLNVVVRIRVPRHWERRGVVEVDWTKDELVVVWDDGDDKTVDGHCGTGKGGSDESGGFKKAEALSESESDSGTSRIPIRIRI